MLLICADAEMGHTQQLWVLAAVHGAGSCSIALVAWRQAPLLLVLEARQLSELGSNLLQLLLLLRLQTLQALQKLSAWLLQLLLLATQLLLWLLLLLQLRVGINLTLQNAVLLLVGLSW